MNFQTFIFIGRSGCGKGTQAKLLMEYLAKAEPERRIYYLETGQKFREFLEKPYPSSILSKRVMEHSERQPDFLAIYMWSHLMVENMEGNEHLVLDGTPRSLLEAKALDTALKFYGRNGACVIFVNTSREWSERRLKDRGRQDDKNEEDIKKRLDWFEADVIPAVEYYRNNNDYRFHEINGEQDIAAVHKDIMNALYAIKEV